jgi:hypothetical protein
VLALILTAAAAVGVAQDRFTLGLQNLPLAADAPGTTASGGRFDPFRDRLTLELAEQPVGEALVYRSALTSRSEQEFRRALWHSPMGRLHYERAAQESMLGREGLVGGGRMHGIGLATSAIGDGDPGGLQLMMQTKWSELTFSDKLQAGMEASFLAALLYYMAEYAD